MRVRQIGWVLLTTVLPFSTSRAAGFDGVSYATKNLEVVKRLSAQRSIIRSQEPSKDKLSQQEDEARAGLVHLATKLDRTIERLRSPQSPYPLLRRAILDYAHLQPIEQSAERGRMYIMYTGELRWPFPAPLLVDLVRIRVQHVFPQPLRDLLTAVLLRWGRDNIDRPGAEGGQRLLIKEWLNDLAAPPITRVPWRCERAIGKLTGAKLSRDDVSALEDLARADDDATRIAALRILGTGGHVKEPAFFSALLADQVVEVQHVSFWGLVLMEGGNGLAHVQQYPGRAQAIGERLKEVRAGVTAQLVAAQTAAFDKAVAAITGKAAVPAKPYVSDSPQPPATTNASADSDAPLPPASPDAPAGSRRHPFVPRAPTHAPTREGADQQFPH